jgi:hypothetical protein
MNSKFKKICMIGGLSSLALVIGSVAVLRVAVANKESALKPCLETLKAVSSNKAIAQIASAVDQDKATDYVVYSVGSLDKAGYWEPLLAINSGVCRILNADREDSDHPISEFVPQAIAEKLTALLLIKKIELTGGKQKFEAALSDVASKSKKPLLMPAENYKSLKKMGVKIPSNVKPFDGVPDPKQVEEERH